MKRKFGLFGLVAVLAVALWATAGLAQDGTVGNVGVGRSQMVAGNTLALTGTPASVVSAVSGKSLCVKALHLGTATATTVQFYDGSGTGSPIGAPIYVPTTGVTLGPDVLGQGFATTAGNALYVSGGQTVTITLRVQKD